MNGYELSRKWFDWSFENPEKISPNHSALYFFAIEHCNRLGWREKFGFPTEMAKDAIGIKSYTTYIKTLNDLVDWGFIKMIERSKNQYSSNIIALTDFTEALDKALDKAMSKHVVKQVESTCESTCESIVSINKHINKETKNNKHIFPEFSEFLSYAVEKEPLICEVGLKRKYDAWCVNGWKDGNDKKITNWKTKLLNTIPYIDKKQNNNTKRMVY